MTSRVPTASCIWSWSQKCCIIEGIQNSKNTSGDTARIKEICDVINREARTLADVHAKRIRELLEGGATLLEIGEALIPPDVERSIDMTRTIVAAAARLVFAGNEARLNELMLQHPKAHRGTETSDAIDRRVDAPQPKIDWDLVEPELIGILPANLYPPKHAKAGRPMLEPIADALNATFPNQPWITPEIVAHRLRNIEKRDAGLAA